MSSDDVAIYLIEIGSNERKLEYCRQILADNSSFTPQAVFNLNSSQAKTTLSKNQLLELFRFTGLTSSQEELEFIYSYFQIDGKNYITLQQFSNIILPQTYKSQNRKLDEKPNDKYPLKYSLQKLLLQILENQVNIKAFRKFNLDLKDYSKSYKRVDMNNLKAFLASHGKFPTQNVLDQILKEILVNKGMSKLHRCIGDYILQFNQKNISSIQKNKIVPTESKELRNKNEFIMANPTKTVNQFKTKPQLQDNTINSLMDKRIPTSNLRTDGQSNSIQAKIKTLMSSISIKDRPKEQESAVLSQKNNIYQNLPSQKQQKNVVKHAQTKQIKQFFDSSMIQKPRLQIDHELTERSNVTAKNQEKAYTRKFSKYRNSKVLSQQNTNYVSFSNTSKTIFCQKSIVSTKVNKQNVKNIKQNEDEKQNQKAKRLQYLKNLVGSNSSQRPSRAEILRF